MSEVRIPGYTSGSDLGGEPVNWLIYDTETKEKRLEWNPAYVPPPAPTELEMAAWTVDEARQELASAVAEYERLLAERSPKPDVTIRCRMCAMYASPSSRTFIVAPDGTEHIGADFGRTLCDLAADGPGWWWPL